MYTILGRESGRSSLHPPSTAELIAAEIRAAITAGEFEPGKPLPQEALAARFGVSRSPLREALRLLEAQGVVTYHSNRGAIVASFNRDELEQIIEIHCVLEKALIVHAIANMEPHVIAQARTRLQQMQDASDYRRWLALHFAFHIELYEAADRPKMLALIVQHVLPVSHLADGEERVKRMREELNAADSRIITACVEGNAQAAVAAVGDHYEPLTRMLCDPLDGEA